MSFNPFRADAGRRDRYQALAARFGSDLLSDIAPHLAVNRDPTTNLGSVLMAGEAAALCEKYGLAGIEDLMVLGLGAAERIARPPISNFHVGAIGLERETGNLLLGGNVEFEGTHLGFTLHGEGFVFTRAFSRGTTVSVLAIGEAHPCAHCRQYLSEFASSRELRLIDPLGHDLGMEDLYPWPFDPEYLGEPGIIAGAVPYPRLTFEVRPPDNLIGERLLAAGRRAHTPYGKCPAAAVLELRDGALFGGSAIESVAFNPGIGPLQAAIVDLLAHGRGYDEIARCWLGMVPDRRVRIEQSTRELLAAIAPEAKLISLAWQL